MPRRSIAAVAAAAISAVLAAAGGNGLAASAGSAPAAGSLYRFSRRCKAQKQAAARESGAAAEPTPGSAPAMGLDDHWADQVFVAQLSAVELGRCHAPSAAAQPASAAEAPPDAVRPPGATRRPAGRPGGAPASSSDRRAEPRPPKEKGLTLRKGAVMK